MLIRCHFFAICFISLLPLGVHSAAPVVDDSDNFATFEEAQAADDTPLAHDSKHDLRPHRDLSGDQSDDFQPLAKDSTRPSSGTNAALLSQVQSMQREIQELRGQVEVQGHEIKQLKEQQLTFYKDLDSRIHQSSPTSSGAPSTAKPLPTATPTSLAPEEITNTANDPARPSNPAEEQIQYLAAYDLIKNKRFHDATIAMSKFVTQYPNGAYTANAHYWLGELYLTQKDYNKAISEFDLVLSKFPASSKAAPSLLKSAYALADSGKRQEASVRLKQILKQYPDTHTAKMANDKLRQLKQ